LVVDPNANEHGRTENVVDFLRGSTSRRRTIRFLGAGKTNGSAANAVTPIASSAHVFAAAIFQIL
jgi:hypothetical protein